MSLLLRGALSAAACLVLSGPARAHVSLATTEAPADAAYRGVLRVPHGCRGAATTAITVTIPEGVIAVHPMPKPGWELAIGKGPYGRAYPYFGQTMAEGARTLTWSGGTLPDDQYDEFTFVGRIAQGVEPGSVLAFPVEQACGTDRVSWAQVAVPGEAAPKEPAPVVKVAAPALRPVAAVRAGDLSVATAWTRATPGGAKVAGGYVRITNTGASPDRLVGGSFPGAGRVEIHEMSTEGGVMRMRPVEGGLAIAPGATVELKPGGFHLMFMDLSAGLKEGEVVRATLVFERAGTVPLEFRVGGIGAQAGPEGPQHH